MMNGVKLLGLQFLAVSFIAVYGIPFKDCGSRDGLVNGVYVQDCSATDNPCNIRSESLSFYINFTTNEGVYDYVSSVGTAWKWGLKKQIFSRQNICNDSLSCPIQPTIENLYTEQIYVPTWVPRGKAYVQWQLSSGEKNIVCIEVTVAKV